MYQYAYDAWNRLVKVTKAYRDSGGTLQTGSVVQESEHDGFGRRIVKAVKNSVALDATYHYYYTGWRLAETRNGSGNVLKQQVWGLSYIDELVQTSLNHDPTDTTEDDCEFDYYALQDAHFNLLGMYGLDETGREALFDYFPMAGPENWVVADVFSQYGKLVERYEYTPYGERTVYFSAGGNDPDAMSPTGMSRRWTAGAATGYDWTLDSTAQPYGLNDIGHQGLMHDEETGLQIQRPRPYSPRLGRFLNRSHWGYFQNRLSLYDYEKSNPIRYVEPFSAVEVAATGGTIYTVGGGGGAIAGSIGGGGTIAGGGGVAATGLGVGAGTAAGLGAAAAAVGFGVGYGVGTVADYGYQASGAEAALVNALTGTPLPPLPDPGEDADEVPKPLPPPVPDLDLDPPGDCTKAQYENLRRSKLDACGKKRSCKRVTNCDTLQELIDNNRRCYWARRNMMNICFRGGDGRHINEANNVRRDWRTCQDQYNKCCNK